MYLDMLDKYNLVHRDYIDIRWQKVLHHLKRLCYMDVWFNWMHILFISKEYDNEYTRKNVELMLSKEFFSYEKCKDFYIVYTYKKWVHQTSQDQSLVHTIQ